MSDQLGEQAKEAAYEALREIHQLADELRELREKNDVQAGEISRLRDSLKALGWLEAYDSGQLHKFAGLPRSEADLLGEQLVRTILNGPPTCSRCSTAGCHGCGPEACAQKDPK